MQYLDDQALDRRPRAAELARALASWQPVARIDPRIQALVRDGKLVDTVDGDGEERRAPVGDEGEATISLEDAQTLPLRHLAGLAIEHARALTLESRWRSKVGARARRRASLDTSTS